MIGIFKSAIVAGALSLCFAGSLNAASILSPGSTVAIVMPHGPTGASGAVLQSFAPALEKALGVSLRLVYKPGGNQMIGYRWYMKKCRHCIMVSGLDAAAIGFKRAMPDKDFEKIFHPIGGLTDDVYVMFVAANDPRKTFNDFIIHPLKRNVVAHGKANDQGSYILPRLAASRCGKSFKTLSLGKGGKAVGNLILRGEVTVGTHVFNNVIRFRDRLRVIGVFDTKNRFKRLIPDAPALSKLCDIPPARNVRGMVVDRSWNKADRAKLLNALKVARRDRDVIRNLEKRGIPRDFISDLDGSALYSEVMRPIWRMIGDGGSS